MTLKSEINKPKYVSGTFNSNWPMSKINNLTWTHYFIDNSINKPK